MSPIAPIALTAGWGLDRWLGEPPTRIHPVALFGSAMTALEQRIHADRRLPGVVYTVVGITVGAAVGLVARKALGRTASVAVVSWLAMAPTMLESESRRVASALADRDIAEARRRVSMLVGRCTDELSESEIARAAIESLAENTTDAVTSTFFWGSVAGAAGAATHRCINTMDAMVGHHNPRFEHFGWAAARVDDIANWVPARLTALAVIVARPRRAGAVLRTIRRDAARHPSPNGGIVEAAFAAALDIQLGGTNSYDGVVDDRGRLGDGARPTGADIERTVVLARHVNAAMLAMTAAITVALTAAAHVAGRGLVRRGVQSDLR